MKGHDNQTKRAENILSIRCSKRNKTFAWFGSAAALLAMVGLTNFLQLQNQSDMSN